MSDISKCEGRKCKVKEKCWRFVAPADPLWQSYAAFDMYPTEKSTDCEHFWALNVAPKKLKKRKGR